jgi:hypothetical protein
MNKKDRLKLLVAVLIIFTPIICDNMLFIINTYMEEIKYVYVSLVVSSIIGLRYIYILLDK